MRSKAYQLISLLVWATPLIGSPTETTAGSQSKTPANTAQEASTPQNTIKKTWEGEWKRDDRNQPAILTVSNVTPTEFKFLIDASSGMNTGAIDGIAKFGANHLDAKASILPDGTADSDQETKLNPCVINFSFPSEMGPESKVPTTTIIVGAQGGCSYFVGTGVSFDGHYLSARINPTYKPSFDCSGTLTAVEKSICQTSILAAGDREMAKVYSALESSDPFEKADVLLKSAQKKWLKIRDRECGAKKNSEPTKMISCLVKQYRQRISKLRTLGASKSSSANLLQFTDYLKPTVDASRDALWSDPYIDLILFEAMGHQNHETFRDHFIVYAESSDVKPQSLSELTVFATIQGDTNEAGIVLTSTGCLWSVVPTWEKHKIKPLVFGPESAKKLPLSKYPAGIKEWLDGAKNSGWQKPAFYFPIPQKC